MASKTKCNCCATMFLGTPIACKGCKKFCCAICRNSDGAPNTCCNCSNVPCARTSGTSQPQIRGSAPRTDVPVASDSVPDAELQKDGFMHPVTKYGTRYKGVGPRGPPLAEFEKDSRWSWQPYQRFVKHVIKHLEREKQLSGEDYRECATWTTDYGIDSPGWNGLQYDENLTVSNGPHPNYYQPAPVAALQATLNVPRPKTQDPPDSLVEIQSAQSSDPSNRFCYDAFWAPGATEDPYKYPFSFATVGSNGLHFFNQEHVMTKEYRPADRIAALASDLESDSYIYLHQEAKKVTVGSLSDPDDIVMEFELPAEYQPQAVGVIKTQGGNRALIHGYTGNSLHTVMLYDLNAGSQLTSIPIRRYEYEPKFPIISCGALQRTLVMDTARPNVCYLGLLSEPAFAIVDTRMSRAARWVKVQDEIRYMTMQTYGNCDKLVYTTGNNLVLYDIVAGKARYQHTSLGTGKNDIGAFGVTSYGEQIAVGRYGSRSQPNISWLSWENFESGTYFDTKKDSKIPGEGGNFLAVNAKGIYAMEHNHAMFAPWQSPIGGQPLVSQVKAPSATASGVAPAQKGVRRAKREATPDSFADPVNLPIPSKPTGFTLKTEKWDGVQGFEDVDRSRFYSQLWVAPGNENPDKYPFSVICSGSGGVNVFDHKYALMGNIKNDSEATFAYPHLASKNMLVASSDGNVYIYGFDKLFGAPPAATITNLGFTPNAVSVMTRSAPQIVIGGDELLLYDMETKRRISDVLLEHAGRKSSAYSIIPDRSRPDVLYVQGLEQAFLVDLRLNPKTSVRSFAPSKESRLYSLVVADYGAYDKLLVTHGSQMSLFDIRSGKVLKQVDGTYGPAANYGSTLCVGTYDAGIEYFDIENLTEKPLAKAENGSGASPSTHCVGANWKGAYRKNDSRLFFYPFKGTKFV